MAIIKYTGEEALGRVADYVNKKLTFASTMPTSPDTNTIVLYVGADTSAYKQGGIYQFDGTDWNLKNLVKTIELTQAEYDALPSAAKLNGTIYFVTDGSADGSIISGYYNETDGEFYEEETHETQYSHHSNTIYIDLANNTTYIYDFENEEYVQVGGSGSGTVIKYVNTLPVTGIEDIIYGIKGYNSFEETIADGFLDENTLFEKEDDLSGGYIYTPAEDVVLDASGDGTTYKGFTSLAYDGTSDWTLTFDDTTDATLADGDTFYFREVNQLFYVGNAEEQSYEEIVLDSSLEYLTAADIDTLMSSVAGQQWDYLADVIVDTATSTKKVWSSSKITTELSTTLDASKTYTDEQISRFRNASYVLVSSTAEMTDPSVLYLLPIVGEDDTYEIYALIKNASDVYVPTAIGTTQTKLEDYYTKLEADAKFALITDIVSKTKYGNEVGEVNNLITTAKEVVSAINELKTVTETFETENIVWP